MKKFLLLFIVVSINLYSQSHWDGENIFGEIGVANSSVQTVPNRTTYTKVTCFDISRSSYGCLTDISNYRIKILKTGYYEISSCFSTKASTAGVTFTTAYFIDDVEVPNIHTIRRWINANDHSSAAMSCYVYILENQYLDVRAKHDSGGNVDITVTYGNLKIKNPK